MVRLKKSSVQDKFEATILNLQFNTACLRQKIPNQFSADWFERAFGRSTHNNMPTKLIDIFHIRWTSRNKCDWRLIAILPTQLRKRNSVIRPRQILCRGRWRYESTKSNKCDNRQNMTMLHIFTLPRLLQSMRDCCRQKCTNSNISDRIGLPGTDSLNHGVEGILKLTADRHDQQIILTTSESNIHPCEIDRYFFLDQTRITRDWLGNFEGTAPFSALRS